MKELQKTIKGITYAGNKFLGEALKIITANQEEAIPYLRATVKRATDERDELEDGFQLHFYALFYWANFETRKVFPCL